MLYVIQAVNFLASADLKVFGRTYLCTMLLLIGLALFLHSGCFCLAYYYFFGSTYKQMILLLVNNREVLHGYPLYSLSTQYFRNLVLKNSGLQFFKTSTTE